MNKHSILIADGDAAIRRVLGAELHKAGYQVETASSSPEAVEKARRGECQAAIVDAQSAVLDGLNVLRQIREFCKDMPIVMLTAANSFETVAEALSCGATACVNKPFEMADLTALLRASLGDAPLDKSVDWSSPVRTVLLNKSQRVTVEVLRVSKPGVYESRIVDKRYQTLTLVCPVTDEGRPRIQAGSVVSIGLAGEDEYYTFESTVLAVHEGNLPTFDITKPVVVYRIERRKYPRVPVHMSIDLSVVEKTNGKAGKKTVLQAVSEDICVGGIRVLADCSLAEGAEVAISAGDAGDLPGFACTGRVARVRPAPEESSAPWVCGMQFTKMNEEARRNIRSMVEAAGL